MRLPINRQQYLTILKKEYLAKFGENLPKEVEKRILKDTAYFYTMYTYNYTNTPYFIVPFPLLNCSKEYQNEILKYFGKTNYKGQKTLMSGNNKFVSIDRQIYWEIFTNNPNFFEYLCDLIENYLFSLN